MSDRGQRPSACQQPFSLVWGNSYTPKDGLLLHLSATYRLTPTCKQQHQHAEGALSLCSQQQQLHAEGVRRRYQKHHLRAEGAPPLLPEATC